MSFLNKEADFLYTQQKRISLFNKDIRLQKETEDTVMEYFNKIENLSVADGDKTEA